MEPIIAAVIAGLGTSVVTMGIAAVTIAWKMGQWQAEARERNKALNKRFDDFIDRIDASITEAHQRIDRMLDPH